MAFHWPRKQIQIQDAHFLGKGRSFPSDRACFPTLFIFILYLLDVTSFRLVFFLVSTAAYLASELSLMRSILSIQGLPPMVGAPHGQV